MTRIHCPNCTYDLAGLDLPAPCPECGTALTEENVDHLQPWPARTVILRRLLWPGAVSPLLIPFWLIHRWPGILASTAIILASMFVPVTVAGSLSVDCCVPRDRDAAFLRWLLLGWSVNVGAWAMCTLAGYLLSR